MLKLGESSLSIDRGYCSKLTALRRKWRPLEKHKVAPYCSASREYMLIANFRNDVRWRSVSEFIYFTMHLLCNMLVSHRGRLHSPCKRETKSTLVRIQLPAPFRKYLNLRRCIERGQILLTRLSTEVLEQIQYGRILLRGITAIK